VNEDVYSVSKKRPRFARCVCVCVCVCVCLFVWCVWCAGADKHWTNPQYRVTVIDGDEGDDDNTGTLIVALLQKQIRDRRARDAQLLIIGYAIYRVSIGPSATEAMISSAFVCVLVSSIRKKLLSRFPQNTTEMWHVGRRRNDWIIVVIRTTLRYG